MKRFSFFLLFLFLVSCGTDVNTQEVETSSDNVTVGITFDERKKESDNESSDDDVENDDYESSESQPEADVPDAPEADEEEVSVIDTVNTELEAEMETMENEPEEPAANDLVTLKTSYKNPKTTVDMTIVYELDADEKIVSINMSAPQYDLAKFTDAISEQIVGKTLEEASEVYVSGSSLATEAYQNALKNQL